MVINIIYLQFTLLVKLVIASVLLHRLMNPYIVSYHELKNMLWFLCVIVKALWFVCLFVCT